MGAVQIVLVIDVAPFLADESLFSHFYSYGVSLKE